MAIILDADVIIRGERGTFDLGIWVESRPEEQFEIAAIAKIAAGPTIPALLEEYSTQLYRLNSFL